MNARGIVWAAQLAVQPVALAVALVVALWACSEGSSGDSIKLSRPPPNQVQQTSPSLDASSGKDATPAFVPDEDVMAKSYSTSIESALHFRSFADKPQGVIRNGEVIKFLIDNRNYPQKEADIYYINSNYRDGGSEVVSWVALHREWAEKTIPAFKYNLKQFSQTAYFTTALAKREFISGRIQTFERDGRVFYGVWFIEMDLIAEEMLQFALEQVARTFAVPEYPLHFVQYSAHQTTVRIAEWLARTKFEVHRLSDLLADVDSQSLNVGEAWGILRVSPKDPDALEATDIPLFETLPLDLAVVAGTITTAYQDVASHVNIKAKERKTPNLMLRNKDEVVRLKAFDGLPIHLSVRDTDYSFELSTHEMVAQKLSEQLSARTWKMPPADMKGTIQNFDTLCRGRAPAGLHGLEVKLPDLVFWHIQMSSALVVR